VRPRLGERLAAALRCFRGGEALRESDERFRALAEHATELIAEIGPDGRYRYVSRSFLEQLGYQPDTLVGRSSGELLHPQDLAGSRGKFLDAVGQGGESRSIHRLRHRDGSWRWYENFGRAYRREDGELCFVSVGRDISRRREQAEKVSHELDLEKRVASLSRSFLVLRAGDIDGGIRRGLEQAAEIAEAHRAFFVVIAPDPPFLGDRYQWCASGSDLQTPLDWGEAQEFRWSCARFARGEVLRIDDLGELPAEAAAERRALEQRGTRSCLGVPVRSGDAVVGFLGFESRHRKRAWSEREVTSLRLVGEIFASAIRRKRAEQALEGQLEVERRIAALSQRFLGLHPEAIEDEVRRALGETGAVAGADRVVMLSFSEGRTTRPDVYEWCGIASPPYTEMKYPWAQTRILSGETIHFPRVADIPEEAHVERERLALRGVQSVLWLPIQSSGSLIGFLSFEAIRSEKRWSEQEITLLRLIGELLSNAIDRLRSDFALRESRAQLMQAQKMDAVGRLAGGVAHDFNNLLTVILGFSKALIEESTPGGQVHQDASEIHGAAERAAALTSQLLAFGRQRMVLDQTVDANDSLRRLQEILTRLLEEDVELILDLAPELDCVRCDPSQLEQLFLNLAVNARDAMPNGGILTFRTENRDVDATTARRIGLPEPGPCVLLSVSDDGSGMDPETCARIFEPFFTTKEPGKGTGLGLSIVYRVVQQAGGTIVVESKPEAGSCFDIYVPSCRSTSQPEPPRAGGDSLSGSETLLVVEDEPALRRLALRVLRWQGYRVLEAADGVAALELAASHAEPIDLLVSDVVMPRMGGGELARRLLRQRSEMRVLFVSGYPQERGRAASQPLPAAGFLLKPFSDELLAAKVRECLDGRVDDTRNLS